MDQLDHSTKKVNGSQAFNDAPLLRDARREKRTVRLEGNDEFGPISENEGLIKIDREGPYPKVFISPEFYKSLCSKWECSLIIKLLGRSIGFRTLLDQLRKLWQPTSGLKLIDIGDGYFVAKFVSHDDLRVALEEVPWMIFGHYLIVRKWQPGFRVDKDTIDMTTVWVRFLGLPLEYNDSLLMTLGNTLGRALKVDANTHLARVCVEIALNKPLVDRFELDGSQFFVEYEGLPLICFKCGCVGHKDCGNARDDMERAAKHPNKPKMPASGFFVFMEEFRKQFKEKHPSNKSVAAVGKAGGDEWKSMTEEEKAPFMKKAGKRKEEYERKMEAYNRKLAGDTDDEPDKSKSDVNDDEEEEGSREDEDEDDD